MDEVETMDALESIFFRRLIQESLTHREGDIFLQAGKFAEAKAVYLREAHKLVRPFFTIPATSAQRNFGVQCDVYIRLNPLDQTNLMGCCLGMAKCLRQENDLEMALAWCEEISSLHRTTYLTSEHPLYDWRTWTIDIPEMTFLRSSGNWLASEIFASLGNSATAATRRWVAISTTVNLPDTHQNAALKSLLDMGLVNKLLESRHPDSQATLNARVTIPALQTRGSWTKLQLTTQGGFTEGRQDFSSFIWHSRLYVAGGRKSEKGPYYRDLWTLDLTKLDAWRKLPDYPVPFEVSGLFMGLNFVVYNDTAILFTGRPSVDVFDLKTETWSTFHTTYTPTPADIAAGVVGGWPYPGKSSCDNTIQILGNKIYVFGGGHNTTRMGCNLFMELNLSTQKWRRLSGTVRVTEHGDYSCPGPRKTPASWVSADKTRIYILFGIFDRETAYMNNELHGETVPFGCSDFWSWSIIDEAWRQERLAGNPPCSRNEMACAYNEKLQKAIIFGGYCPNLRTYLRREDGREECFPYSYVADTFFYDMMPPSSGAGNIFEPTLTAPKWKHVLTPGFPTYRCQARLECDPDTGRTYLFGGWTNSQYIPTRSKLLAKTFGDVWELRIDVPGGHFEEVDFEEEARIAKVGFWQRCFSCAAAGPWKKCGGSCKGRVFFCGTTCLRDGWKEHKQMHQCRKA
ncbi:hypothetical protein C8R44DRAFT_981641 [Mycena epipterygia]|nr:hypothetical protein C8R44DRAFT_981641 [Mycena epipterygia]